MKIPSVRRFCVVFKGSGLSVGCMITQDMHFSIQSVFKMFSLSVSNRNRVGDEFNPILEAVISCIISGFQASGGILIQKKQYWIPHMEIFLQPVEFSDHDLI